MTNDELIAEIEAQRDLMVAVSTGGPRIDSVNSDYKQRRSRIAAGLRERGLKDPNPFSDLWRWYGHWSAQLGSYASRRAFVSELYEGLLDEIEAGAAGQRVFEEPTGWDRVDRGVGKARAELQAATDEEDFQSVGLHCREILISLGEIVFDPAVHQAPDGVVPSQTDAARRLEGYLNSTLSGSSNAELRGFAKKAVTLALALQHRRTATFRDAAICLEATNAVVNIVAVVAGQREAHRDLEPETEPAPW